MHLLFPFLCPLEDYEDWTAFTSVETTGGEVVLGFETVWLGGMAGWFWFFKNLAINCVWIETRTPYAGGSVEGLEGSEVGRGVWGIRSYKVPD